jgi:3-oxoacyl-(acyl-carrier-protein) synthase
VPQPTVSLPFLREARLRRTSPISRFAVFAALDALGPDRAELARRGVLRLGVIFVIMNGSVNFSQRFYGEVLDDPRTASPLIFPETVFNAPSSHLSALLGARTFNYTLVGDAAQFVAAFEVAAQWLAFDEVDGALIVGAEEFDWLSAEGAVLLDRNLIVAEGAAAVYIESSHPGRIGISGPFLFTRTRKRSMAARMVRDELERTGGERVDVLLFDGLTGAARTDKAERAAWRDWSGPRRSVKTILGDGLGAGTGWQCVAAAASLSRGAGALVSAVGANQHAAGLILDP